VTFHTGEADRQLIRKRSCPIAEHATHGRRSSVKSSADVKSRHGIRVTVFIGKNVKQEFPAAADYDTGDLERDARDANEIGAAWQAMLNARWQKPN
jgi:hypothetical protein